MNRKKEYADLSKWRKTSKKQKRRYYDKTKGASNSGKRWTQEDIDLVIEHKMTDTELSALIGRSVGSIQGMRCIIKKMDSKNEY